MIAYRKQQHGDVLNCLVCVQIFGFYAPDDTEWSEFIRKSITLCLNYCFSYWKFIAQMQYNAWVLYKFVWKHRRSDFVFVFWTENIWILNSHTVCKQ